ERSETRTSKILVVKNELSVQSHQMRDEEWKLLYGKAAVYRGAHDGAAKEIIANLEESILDVGDTANIPRKMVHGVRNIGTTPVIIAEIARGIAVEGDIIRYYDIHGRYKTAEEKKMAKIWEEIPGYRPGMSLRELIPLVRANMVKREDEFVKVDLGEIAKRQDLE
ncbi:hypothetical protein HYU13_03550, partial [Candidatus Woesearchaeota archaeon]|nr:hypothetical protein [Candidatus Woesearchaeota archaeon]